MLTKQPRITPHLQQNPIAYFPIKQRSPLINNKTRSPPIPSNQPAIASQHPQNPIAYFPY